MERYDIAIVGGGMAGLSLLALLEPAIAQGLNVTLIDPATTPTESTITSPSFDDRATALSTQTLDILSHLRLHDLNQSVSDITAIEVSDEGHAGYHHMIAKDHHRQRFGAVIANRTLGSLLWSKTQPLPVHWKFNTKVSNIQLQEGGALLTTKEHPSILARQVILCDGGRSGLEKKLGFSTQTHDFNAIARVAVIKSQHQHLGTAFERFTQSGPIALLPFGEYSALVWTVSNQDKTLLTITPELALTWLNTHFGQRLGQLTDIGQWSEYPLIERQLSNTCCHGVLALGNSAATLHPVAGQGFNLAIRGIARVANQINQRYLQSGQIPTFSLLNQVANDIAEDQTKTVAFSHQLINLFSSSSPLLQVARGLGLSSMDRHPLISQSFALAGMGLLESIPASTYVNQSTRRQETAHDS